MSNLDIVLNAIEASKASSMKDLEAVTTLSRSTIRRYAEKLYADGRIRVGLNETTGAKLYLRMAGHIDKAVQPTEPLMTVAMADAVLRLPARSSRGRFPVDAFIGGMRVSKPVLAFWRHSTTKSSRVTACLHVYDTFVVAVDLDDLAALIVDCGDAAMLARSSKKTRTASALERASVKLTDLWHALVSPDVTGEDK